MNQKGGIKEFLEKTVFSRELLVICLILNWLIGCYVYHYFFYADFVMRDLFRIWGIVILLHDIFTKSLYHSKTHTALWIFTVVAILSITLEKPFPGISAYSSILYLIVDLYVVYSTFENSHDNFFSLIDRCARLYAFIVVFVSLASLFGLLCSKVGIHLPLGLDNAEHLYDQLEHYGNGTRRFDGYFGYSVNGSNKCYIALILLLYLQDRGVITSLKTIIGAGIIAVMMLAMDVRTGYIILFTVIVCWIYFYLRKKYNIRKSILLVVLGAVVLLAALAMIRMDKIQYWIDQIQRKGSQGVSDLTSGRNKLWKNYWEAFLQHPILGLGWENSSSLIFFDGHNIILNLLAWTGLLGFLPMLYFFIITFKNVIKNKRYLNQMHSKWLAILILCVTIHSMFDRTLLGTYMYTGDTVMFWLCAGYINGLKN